MPSHSLGTQPADVPYAITVVGSEYYNPNPWKSNSDSTLLLPPAMPTKGLRRNDDSCSTESWYLNKIKMNSETMWSLVGCLIEI
jgi:hypothetical protein